MRILLFSFFILLHSVSYGQLKTDVIVVGASACGVSAAIQAARSGVKVILINKDNSLIGPIAPLMNVPAFNKGIWKEWRDSCKTGKDSLLHDPRLVLEKILNNEKKVQYFKNTPVLSAIQKKNKWEITIKQGDKNVEIKSAVLVDAESDISESIIYKQKLLALPDQHIQGLTQFTPDFKTEPYTKHTKLYRTSGAAGFGKDSSTVQFLPLGAFISKEKENLLVGNSLADISGFAQDAFHNIALWMNIGQMIGASAAYAPFFGTDVSKANIRMIQGEVMNYKSFIYPLVDVPEDDIAWLSIQKVVAAQLLEFNFETGEFFPDKEISSSDIKDILSELHPRSRIWFIENPTEKISVKQIISLLSFITGRESFDLEREISVAWKDHYQFQSDFNPDHFLTKKEAAVLFDVNLKPFNIRVNMSGFFII